MGACPDGLTMSRQIEREPCARALVVPDLGCYPCWPACLRNASLRKVTITPSYTHSRNGAKRPGAGGRSSPGAWGTLRVTQSQGRRAERGCGWEEVAHRASMGLETPHLVEDRIPDGTRTSGPRVDHDLIGAPAGATSMPRWMWGRLARNRGYEEVAAKSINEGGQGRGHVVHDPGKDDEQAIDTVECGCNFIPQHSAGEQ